MSISLQQLADRIGARVDGDGAAQVHACAPIDTAGPDEISFVANAKYFRFLDSTRAAAVILHPDSPAPDGLTRLIADDPYFAFRNAMIALHGFRRHPEAIDRAESGVSEHASVHPEATIGAGVVIHPHVVVEQGAAVGDNCVLYPGSYVGQDARLGEACILYPNAVVYDRCILGDRVILHSSTVVGQDGFGYATHDGAHHKIPQAGIVVLGDDVELGAGCAIERAAMGETRIGSGTKFADLISIGHGTTIGEHCLLVSLVGISGSVDVGNYVVLGGQVGVAGHLTIGDGVQAAGKTAIVSDLAPGSKVAGIPSTDLEAARRNVLVGKDLYGMSRRIKKLEKMVTQLQSQLEQQRAADSTS